MSSTTSQPLIKVSGVKAVVACSQESTLSIIIMDRSGSMEGYEKAVKTAINNHLEAIKNSPDSRQQYCMVVSFATTYRVDVPLAHANQIQQMTDYSAKDFTLLFKTVYKTIKLFLGPYLKSPTAKDKLKVVVGVFTDGEDNQSPPAEYPKKLKKIVKIAKDAGWELLTFGFEFDAKDIAEKMAFPTDDKHAFTVEKSQEGIAHSTQTFSSATTGFRGRDYEK